MMEFSLILVICFLLFLLQQKPNLNVAPLSSHVQVEFTVLSAAFDAMVLRTVLMAVMKKTAVSYHFVCIERKSLPF